MTGKRLCITPCGKAKVWDHRPDAGEVEAREAYVGAFAKACRAYAAAFFDEWVILSAKHGFLRPNDLLQENYDVSFTSPLAEQMPLHRMQAQLDEKGFAEVRQVVVLGGSKYVRAVRRIFGEEVEILTPLSGCRGIGYMLQRMNQAVRDGKEIRENR